MLQQIESSGTTIAVEIVGSGPAVLLTHGYAASSHMFRPNAAALAARNTVVTWDIRGHGASGSPQEQADYSVTHAVQDMVNVLDAVGVERAVLGGHSLGGFLSLAFHAAHPQRVRALILIDTGPGYRKPEPRDGWNEMAEKFARNFERRGFVGHNGGEEFDPSVHIGGPGGLAKAARGILTQHDSVVIDSLPAIEVPTLIVVGSDDAPFIGGSEYMAAKIPHASLVVIAGAGHAPNVTHAAEFDTAVEAFLAELEANPDG